MSDLQPPVSSLWPAVTCLCPTYGRFERLRDAIACFLLQDYSGEKRLLILNDAPVPLLTGPHLPFVQVRNAPTRYPTLGHKRQALLELAETPLVAHWDDDDLYLPWHLRQCVSALLERGGPPAQCGTGCVKPGAAWWGVGPREGFELRGPCHNVFEGQMVFGRRRALELGGYPPKVSGQAKALLAKFRKAGELYAWNPADRDISYIYRWAGGLHHISGGGDNVRSHRAFGARNQDFGEAQPLIPAGPAPIEAWARARLRRQFARLPACSRRQLREGVRPAGRSRIVPLVNSNQGPCG
ncbi:MAG: glycosyltransferase family 2 protein [Candidatus Brocadiae bacterium]|nr:glycosyltransferase family 2 protein [Candidatus Brocadiia bacterium]